MMDQTGIDKAVVSTYWEIPGPDPDAFNRFKNSLSKNRDRLIGFLRINPWYGDVAVETFEQTVRRDGIQGLKIHPVTCPVLPYGELVLKLLKKAGELKVPALFHSGDDPLSLPLQIAKAAAKCPETTIIMGHMGGFFYVQDAIRSAEKHANIFLDTSVMPYPRLIKKAVKILGAKRVVYGSDAPGVHPKVELLKVRTADLGSEAEERVLGLNMLELLKQG